MFWNEFLETSKQIARIVATNILLTAGNPFKSLDRTGVVIDQRPHFMEVVRGVSVGRARVAAMP